jgi:hypothetical protein
MKHLSIAIVFILAFSFCKNKGTNNTEFKSELVKNDSVFRLSEHYSKFKFHDLKEFKLDAYLDDNEVKKHYQPLDSLIKNSIFKGDDTSSPYDSYFCYSTFSDSTLITIVEESEGNGYAIWLCKFNKKGKFIDKEIIANHLIDGGEFWRSRGQLIDSNTFIHTEIDAWDLENGDEQIDSTIVNIRFDKNNKFKIDTLFKNQEIIKNKKE